VRSLLDVAPSLRRDTGGLTATVAKDRLSFFARAEVRSERGRPMLAVGGDSVRRLQGVVSGAVQWEPLDIVRASLRLNWAHSTNHDVLEARVLEGTAGLAFRLSPAMVLLRYAVTRDLLPARAGEPSFAESLLQVASVMPSVRIGKFGLGAGAHAAWARAEDGVLLSASLRPSFEVVSGLELAAEVARRSRATDGGELTALRGELGYRFNESMLIAAGYTMFGFSGIGIAGGAEGRNDRLYLRAELGY
jgi:hypothetical protein